MNTRIARKLNEARRQVNAEREIKIVGEEVVVAHNIAVAKGFIELPMLEYVGAEGEEARVDVYVMPRSGMIGLSDLYNLKRVWGADDVEVLTAAGTVGLVFRM